MKKVTLIASIATVLLFAPKAKAQTVVSAGGKTVTLNTKQTAYLHTYKNPTIDSALKSCINIKYNSTADMIIALLKERKRPDSLLITATTR